MNTQLTEDRRISAVSSQRADAGLKRPRPPSSTSPGSRPTLLERVALRIGVALIIWGRRSKAMPDRSEALRRYEAQTARDERERHYQQGWLLVGPRR
jgi:hypothetical protein